MTDGIAPERVVALRVLRRVDDGAYADRALLGEARRAGLSGPSRAVATRLAYGTVQRRRTLDWVVDRVVERPDRVEAPVRDVLRLGTYELLFSDGVPDHAAVDQAVRLARTIPGGRARRSARSGLVNAVLRRVADGGRGLLAELDPGDPAEAAVLHSMPDWIAGRLWSAFGAEADAIMAAQNLPAESALRWNPLRGPRASLEAELPDGTRRDALVPEAYVLDRAFALEDSAAWARGRAMGQSRASMLVAHALAPRPGERVLDLCAAPGAKATHVAALTRNRARVTAVELHASRGQALERLARRLGARVEVVVGDGREIALEGGFDAVMVDPPCTGTGVLASRPDARWRRREDALEPLAELQRGLLQRALAEVRPGGRVVYSTCSLLAEENEAVVVASGGRLEDLTAEYPELAHPRLPGALLTRPDRDRTDGFFIARLTP
jgi:16S rRNA (cytosine967-C5)-methyltransferase